MKLYSRNKLSLILILLQQLPTVCVPAFVLTICAGLSYAQSGVSTGKPLVGCYEVTSLKWTPAGQDQVKSPLEQFELSSEPDRGSVPSEGPFRVHTLARNHPWEALWNWRPSADGHSLRISLSYGLGGFRGSFHLTGNEELVGQLKEYCDYRCDWKRQTAHIHARKIPCTSAEK